ncbi:MAG: hypothetical protein Tsb0034_21030 [Ekhidna sp.]
MTRFVFSIAVFSSLYLNGQVLNYTTSVKIDDNVKTTETSLFIEISNKEENWLSKVSIHHSPNQKFKLLYAQIIDANGKVVRELKKKDVRSRSLYSSEAFFQDDLEKSFDLYWGSYPYRIKYSYSISENEFFSLVRWWPTPFSNVRTDESILRLEVPDDYGFLIDSTQNLLFSKRLTEEKTVYSWSAMNIDRYEEEPFSPSYWELIPHVFAVPKRFQYGVSGSSSSWQEFGNWQAKLNEGTTQLPIKEQQIIDNLVRNASSKIEIIKKIYHYLQDKTTYVNVSIEKGGLKSYPASYVSRNKFGDCKALTTYMKAMLKHIGIDSYYTLIRAGENEHNIVKTLPGQQFNHVILTIPLNQDTIWLETTSQTSPFDYLGTFTQNRNALFIKEESELVKTPKLSEDDVLIEDKYFLELNESGEGNFTLNRTSRGKEFEIISAHISSLT